MSHASRLHRTIAVASGTALTLGALSLSATAMADSPGESGPKASAGAEVTGGTLRWVLPATDASAVSVDGGAAVAADGRTVTLVRAEGDFDTAARSGKVAFDGRIHLTATDGTGARTTISDVHVAITANGTSAIVGDYQVTEPAAAPSETPTAAPGTAKEADAAQDVTLAELPAPQVAPADDAVTVTAPTLALARTAPAILAVSARNAPASATPAITLALTTRSAPALVAAPAAAGKASATTGATTVTAGGSLGFSVAGYPAGQKLTVKLDDDGILSQFTIKADGTYAGSVTIPKDTATSGSHWLRFLAPNPATSVKGASFTVTAASTGSAGPTPTPSAGTTAPAKGGTTGGTTGGTGTTGTDDAPAGGDTLASTGSDATAPLLAAGALLTAGAAALVATRRRLFSR
ncbi:HtaA domain-containing protein [Streptomyces sp. H39-S7]|uniref:HtaA domain-containing protein n=1 Tax=Streptomyces sp. H39-S7 TaxID=3004357 RepID=UPI0022AFE2C8|nr:HtaA domain-containing protein [Streptomyces sp. H39-S7]MCZ4123081.1 HtaA domain-containing protein [Streptomyces sp. H39-S7]